jgi:hypothetical protein
MIGCRSKERRKKKNKIVPDLGSDPPIIDLQIAELTLSYEG